MVDHQDLHGSLFCFEFQPQLFAHGSDQRRSRIRSVAGWRRRARRTHRRELCLIRSPFQREVPPAVESRLVNDRAIEQRRLQQLREIPIAALWTCRVPMTKVWRARRFSLPYPPAGARLRMEPEPGGLATRESFLFWLCFRPVSVCSKGWNRLCLSERRTSNVERRTLNAER